MAIAVTKQAVATRLLKSAVRSYLSKEDRIATYLLACASARILADLAERKGLDWLSLSFQRSLFYWAVEQAEGRYSGPHEFADVSILLAEGMKQGHIAGPQDVVINGLDPRVRRLTMKHINRQYNFLKHADTDALSSLPESDIDPVHAISRASTLFLDVFPNVDLDEAYLFKYLKQRESRRSYSLDVEPWPRTFEGFTDDKLHAAILDYLRNKPSAYQDEGT